MSFKLNIVLPSIENIVFKKSVRTTALKLYEKFYI